MEFPKNLVKKVKSALCLSMVLAFGCTGGGETSEPTDGPTYVRDIEPLVAVKCAGCHTEGGIAPFALETYDQVSAMKSSVVDAVTSRTMPPWLTTQDCADYRGDISLTDDQINTITQWYSDGMPMGNPEDAPVMVPDNRPSLSRVDYELPLPVAYTPKNSPDDYRCFFVDWPATDTMYATGFGVDPDNDSIVHHVIAFVVRPSAVPDYEALDDLDSEPGWECYGGPGGDNFNPSTVGWLGAWAPGGNGEDFAAGTGIEVVTGSKVIVQMHYNVLGADPAPDQTKILVRVDPSVEKKAAIMPFANPTWLSGGMPIPAHSNDVSHTHTADPSSLIGFITGGAIPAGTPLTIHGAGLHLHTRGTRANAFAERADGSKECLVDIPQWDFNWQQSYNFKEPKQLVPGDKLNLECHWDNPTDKDLNWGDGTADEMCLGIFYVSE